MKRTFLGVCLLASAIVTTQVQLPAQEAKSQSDKNGKTEPAKPEKLTAIGKFAGKVLDVDKDGKSFKLRVYGQTAEPTFTPGNPAAS